MTEPLVSADSPRASVPPASPWLRLLTLGEVTLWTLLIPAARMGYKCLTPDGAVWAATRHMGFGVIAVAASVCLFLAWHKQDFNACGITLQDWPGNLKIGVVLSLLCAGVVVASVPIFRRAGINHFTGWEAQGRILALCFALPALALLVWIFRVAQAIAKRLPTTLGIALYLGLWATPLMLAWHFNRPWDVTLIAFLGSVIVAGPGEEIIFRGYIQSRLNAVFGRPFCLGGMQFGWGWPITAFLFGIVHIFNGFDPIHGHYDLQWTWGLGGFISGLMLGYLREKTGSVLSGAIFHGNNDAWVLILQNLR